MSTDLRDLRPDKIALLTNAAIIAVSQDPLGEQAEVVVDDRSLIVLRRPLANGDWAVAVVNVSDTDAEFAMTIAELFDGVGPAATSVVDVFSGEVLDGITELSIAVQHRDVSMYIVTLEV